jgi:hypothetical protein
MDIKYVEEHTIFETAIGSQAYGINRPDSDIDKAGVMIPGQEYFLGLEKFDQFQGYEEEDKVIYDIRKILSLMSQGNPNCMDLLFVPDRCIIKTTSYWEKIKKNRDLFISLRCKFTFSGYAASQIRRIRGHRAFLLNPITVCPKRSDFGLPEGTMFPTMQLKAVMSSALEYIQEHDRTEFVNELDRIYGDYVVPLFESFLIDKESLVALEWLQLGIKAQSKAFLQITNYVKEEYVEMAKKELEYYTAMKQFHQYQEWKKHRNKARAEMEAKFGFDPKHSAHLIRLLRMGKEILETGQINVDRTNIDAEELKAIRNGAWTYDQVEEYAKKMDKELDVLYETSTLPKHPNMVKIKELCVEVVSEYLKDHPE